VENWNWNWNGDPSAERRGRQEDTEPRQVIQWTSKAGMPFELKTARVLSRVVTAIAGPGKISQPNRNKHRGRHYAVHRPHTGAQIKQS
jgi:hypothetical protein